MKIGIKKVHENEWLVHIGPAVVKMDQFSVALLDITLEHLLALEHGESHSTLTSYVKLGLRIKELGALECQKLLRALDNKDVLLLMLIAQDSELNAQVMKNTGGILAKQLEADVANSPLPDEEVAKAAIRRIVEKMFELEASGKIEFTSAQTQYI